MGSHFAQLLLYDQCLKSRSAAVRESLILEMVRIASDIIKLAMSTLDLRTQHLSDHIYHVITFAAVSLCRLLHIYEQKLSNTLDVAELDQLVLTSVDWLLSIGLSCHVSHILADVVSAFHVKLRGQTRHVPDYGADPWSQTDFPLLFPDPLSIEGADGQLSFVPDWDPYIQGAS